MLALPKEDHQLELGKYLVFQTVCVLRAGDWRAYRSILLVGDMGAFPDEATHKHAQRALKEERLSF
jgi:hypothetical protein